MDANSSVFSGCERLKEIYNKAASNEVNNHFWNNNSGVYDGVNVYSDTDEATSPKLIIENGFAFVTESVYDYSVGHNVDKLSIVAYLGDSEEVVVPTTVTVDNEEQAVARIGSHAFYQCYSVKTVHITEGVTTLSANAFYYCANLETVTFDQTTEGSYWNYRTVNTTGTATRLTEEDFVEGNASLFNVQDRLFQWNEN